MKDERSGVSEGEAEDNLVVDGRLSQYRRNLTQVSAAPEVGYLADIPLNDLIQHFQVGCIDGDTCVRLKLVTLIVLDLLQAAHLDSSSGSHGERWKVLEPVSPSALPRAGTAWAWRAHKCLVQIAAPYPTRFPVKRGLSEWTGVTNGSKECLTVTYSIINLGHGVVTASSGPTDAKPRRVAGSD